jgi:hypothetical protein
VNEETAQHGEGLTAASGGPFEAAKTIGKAILDYFAEAK